MIVADTGPIIAFARIGRLDLLRQVAQEVVIPQAVYEEIIGQGEVRPGAKEIADSQWIKRRTVSNTAILEGTPPSLHSGEREAIALAEELGAPLLIDEVRGRRHAAERGIPIFGSLTVLADAKRRGHVSQVRPYLKDLLEVGYWVDEDLIRVFLQQVGESDL
tara:strand:- start:1193 stop:1678 length:486 start_codon:yes stop_codon:yes gene_type:complete